MTRRRRVLHDADREATAAASSSVNSGLTPLAQRVLELQRTAGNEAVTSSLGKLSVQRDDKAADAPIDIRPHLLDLRGVSAIKVPDPTPPWLPKAAPSGGKAAEPDKDPAEVWKLDFDLDAKDDSPLAQELARAKQVQQVLQGGKGQADTPLGLQLTNAAVNILANTDKGQELVTKMHLDKFSVVVDPTSGNYGVLATFRFGK